MSRLPDNATIAAVATPAGYGGVGIVRISGARARTIGLQLTARRALQDRRATFCRFIAADGEPIDEGIALLFARPRSYTGEDVFEAHAHGGPVVLEMLLARVLELGARMAEPGEFSRRAFLNGKRDLAQLSAVADLINSASQQAARSARRVVQGEFSAQVRVVCEELKSLRALIEATLDFPDEEDVTEDNTLQQTLCARVKALAQAVAELERRATGGMRLHEGLELVIAGQPNVGKSSLLNCLAQRETAIVCDAPGTTRDVVRCDILIDGMPMRVLDTAGLRPGADAAEREGIRRAHQAMESADVVVVLADATAGLGAAGRELLDKLAAAGANVITALNKSDLLKAPPPESDTLYVSAKTGAGIAALCAAIKEKAGVVDLGEDTLVVQRRYLDALSHARKNLAALAHNLTTSDADVALDMLAQDLRDTHQSLSALLGEYATEDMLGDIFSRFCIGK